jgi:hypothetical protein
MKQYLRSFVNMHPWSLSSKSFFFDRKCLFSGIFSGYPYICMHFLSGTMQVRCSTCELNCKGDFPRAKTSLFFSNRQWDRKK